MDNFLDILTVGKKKGEWDFSIRATIMDYTHEEMNEFRAMCMVAIGSAEEMWRYSQEKKNPASKSNDFKI